MAEIYYMSRAHQPISPGTTYSARTLAVRQLSRIEVDGAFIGIGGEDATATDARETRQATDYVAGVTRWRRRLDFLLAHFYRGDFEKMEPTLKQILRIGLYDLLYLDTPPHAALNEAVELAKQMLRPGAGKLVNGILRAIQRRRDSLPEPQMNDLAERLAVAHSHPSWLVRRWLEQFGTDDAEALMRWNNQRPVYGLRVNTLATSVAAFCERLNKLEIEWEASPFLDDFLRIPRLQPVLRGGLLADGLCAVQDESAGLVVRLLDPQPGETIADTCAAPGGKALYAAQRMQNRGRLLAYDVHEARLHLADIAAEKLGVTMLETSLLDLTKLSTHTDLPKADRVLVDAPCSGLGVLAKRADLRWNRTPEEMETLVDLQDTLLDAATHLIKPGGLLVYSTCTIDPVENHSRVRAFLQRQPTFAVEPAHGIVPDEVVTPEGYLATLPHRHHIDGAFGVRLRQGS